MPQEGRCPLNTFEAVPELEVSCCRHSVIVAAAQLNRCARRRRLRRCRTLSPKQAALVDQSPPPTPPPTSPLHTPTTPTPPHPIPPLTSSPDHAALRSKLQSLRNKIEHLQLRERQRIEAAVRAPS
jgi:hypothetical protein